MVLIAWIPLLTMLASGVAYVLLDRWPDAKKLSGWLFLAASIALEMALAGHVAQIGSHP